MCFCIPLAFAIFLLCPEMCRNFSTCILIKTPTYIWNILLLQTPLEARENDACTNTTTSTFITITRESSTPATSPWWASRAKSDRAPPSRTRKCTRWSGASTVSATFQAQSEPSWRTTSNSQKRRSVKVLSVLCKEDLGFKYFLCLNFGNN